MTDHGYENGQVVPVDNTHPVESIEPLLAVPEIKLARDALFDGIRWLLRQLTPCEVRPGVWTTSRETQAKVVALLYLLRMDGRSLADAGEPLGISKQALDWHVRKFSEALRTPRQRRQT